MTLSEVLQCLDTFDDEATIIVAEPWTAGSAAQVVETPASGAIADIERDGLAYFLEVALARELKEDWPPGNTDQAFCERLIQYAINDA